MKNLLLVIALAFSLNTIAQVPTYVPNNGLVGYWPFNGNANDESVNNNNGTVNGAALTADRFGKANSAYDFDGVNDFIEVLDNPSLNFPNNTQSVSFWVKMDAAPSSNSITPILAKSFVVPGNGNKTEGFMIHFGNPTLLFYSIKTYCCLWGDCPVDFSTNYNNLFQHVVYTNNGILLKCYINGILTVTTSLVGSTVIGANTEPLFFGKENSVTEFFNGQLDEVGIWNRALSPCEVQDLYNSQLNSTNVIAGTNQTICNGEIVTLNASNSMNYIWNNNVVDGTPFSPVETSNYIATADSAGCKSIDSLTVTVNQPTSSSINETTTNTYISPSGIVYYESGVYYDTIPNTMNCDSIITINLNMEPTGINEYNSSLISLFPNPASSQITINGFNNLTDIKNIEITSITGEIVRKENIRNSVINISILNPGMYLLFISHKNGFEQISFLKE